MANVVPTTVSMRPISSKARWKLLIVTVKKENSRSNTCKQWFLLSQMKFHVRLSISRKYKILMYGIHSLNYEEICFFFIMPWDWSGIWQQHKPTPSTYDEIQPEVLVQTGNNTTTESRLLINQTKVINNQPYMYFFHNWHHPRIYSTQKHFGLKRWWSEL